MTVYKYYTFENKYSLSNLEKGIIYFALANEWKKDNEIEFEYKMNTYEDIFIYLLIVAKNLEITNKKQYDFNKKNHTLQLENPYRCFGIEELMSFSAKSFLHNKEKNEANYRNRLLNAVRLFSTCKADNNNNNWKEFANHSSGFCVGYDSSSWKNISCNKVDYSDEIPIIDFISSKTTNYPLYRLPKKFEPEDEIRFLKVIEGAFRKHENECIKKLSPTDIVSITAGINIKQENLDKLKTIAQIHYPHIQVKVGIY